MLLTQLEKEMLDGIHGKAARKSMEILVTLGEIYGAERMVEVNSVQVAGVSYANLGEPGLEFLAEMAEDGRVRVLTTLNPAGMDLENWTELGIDPDFAKNQERAIKAFQTMGIVTTCTCTPYLVGNLPLFNEHVAWSESSAVCFANSIMGAKTNREGGPSALAAALTGRTPMYGLHLDENRQAQIRVDIKTGVHGTNDYGTLGKVIGDRIGDKIPYITGIESPSLEELKALCASIATYGGTALFHIEGVTPNRTNVPTEAMEVTPPDMEKAERELNDETTIDFVGIGCPHASIHEIKRIAELLKGKRVTKEVWIATARPIKQMADRMGYTATIEASGAKFACDTCFAVAPLKGRFKGLATDSAKGCFYGRGRNKFSVKHCSLEECIAEAIR